MKRRNRNLKVILSIGGWTYSVNFAAPASSDAGRRNFAATAVALLKDYGLDGLDLDWEFPKTPEEGQNYVLLLQACREAMDAYAATVPGNPHFELTVACPAGASNWQHMKLAAMDPLLDFWNLMAYDYAGSWDSSSGHQANLVKSVSNPSSTPFCTDEAIQHYIGNGVPAHKIVLGMPLYGRAFENTRGIGQPFNGVGQANEALYSWEAGAWDYKVLPLAGAREIMDEEAGATYSFDESKGIIITYDNVEMARRKTAWALQRGLGGAMWWESSGDRRGGLEGGSLIAHVVDALGGPAALLQQENCITYPQSKYDNLRNGTL